MKKYTSSRSLLSDVLLSERKSTAPETPRIGISKRDVIHEVKPKPRQTVYAQILDVS